MFKFNFLSESENDANSDTIKNESAEGENEYDNCLEIVPTNEHIENALLQEKDEMKCMSFGKVHKVFYVPVDEILDTLIKESDEINRAENSHSDLVAGVYEGGAKIWECTHDLGEFLCDQKIVETFANTKVLDLGCGAGILGIIALKNGAKVHFQDYNNAVLQHITIPNVLINLKQMSELSERCQFYSGDWSNYIAKTESDNQTFDFILTSETIYNIQSYEKIINVLTTKLKPNGTCYLAAKSHYFGVGGSMRHFESVLLSKCNQFQSETVFVCHTNVSREILKIAFKKIQ